MGFFEKFKETKKLKIETDISKELAKRAVADLLNVVKKSKVEESLQLVRSPSKESEGLQITFSYHGATVTAPLYAYFAVRNLAKSAGIPFEQMISFIEIINELLPDVSRTDEMVKKNGTDEKTDK